MTQETDEDREARTGLASLRLSDEASAKVQKTEHRVTLDSMLTRIKEEDYISPSIAPHLTLCILLLDNGYLLVGKSVPADPENFDREIGRRFAREDAIRSMWPLEAYALRERLTGKLEAA